MILELIFGL